MTGDELYQILRSDLSFFRTEDGRRIFADMLIDMGQEEAAERIRRRESWIMAIPHDIEAYFRTNFAVKREDCDTYPIGKNYILLIRKPQ